ncbi:peptidylprolyl isomerase [Mesoflavibacter sp. CH_XMU1404-2]|uniref:peptidylprolyl isomerase n=1 Tax=Mesoflavibacter sp. CH_XMU1404-2 TaxID=3107766 RepID=UPI00300828C4
MKLRHLSALAVIVFSAFFSVNAQEKQVLFSVEDTPVYASEFERVYKKNLELVKDESQKDIDNYLDLFIKYKLKVAEAKALGLDQKPAYLREFEGYKKQLSANFLSNNEVTENLVKEAYERLKHEINARHILVKIDENAPEDQQKLAQEEIEKLRGRVIDEGFEAVKKDIHNGRTLFAEELGYFTAFRMVYNFETAAYNTEVGKWSQPFQTQFGYHIVQVNDKRENRGEITVAHIMLTDKDTNTESAEERINDIYKRIKQGEDFEALANQFSEDKSSSNKGGRLNTFSSGQLSSEIFEDKAFGLENTGEITEPFKSEFGYHIVKLIDKKGLNSFKEMEAELKAKVKKDSRSVVINNSRFKKLKEKYKVKDNPEALRYFTSILNEDYYQRSWNTPENFEGNKVLFTMNDQKVTYKDFAEFLYNTQRRRQARQPFDKLVASNYKDFLESKLTQYQENNLEFENEEYAQILNEYRDGLLLFDLMESKVWNAAREDSIGLENYYKQHQEKYFFDTRADAVIASSANKKDIKKVAKMLENNESIEAIKKQINSEKAISVSFIKDTVTTSHQALPKDFNMQKGVSKVFKHNDAYSVVKVNTVLPKTQKTFEEAKGKVISDFQEYKEKMWLDELSKKYKVKVNQDVLKQVKKDLN